MIVNGVIVARDDDDKVVTRHNPNILPEPTSGTIGTISRVGPPLVAVPLRIWGMGNEVMVVGGGFKNPGEWENLLVFPEASTKHKIANLSHVAWDYVQIRTAHSVSIRITGPDKYGDA